MRGGGGPSGFRAQQDNHGGVQQNTYGHLNNMMHLTGQVAQEATGLLYGIGNHLAGGAKGILDQYYPAAPDVNSKPANQRQKGQAHLNFAVGTPFFNQKFSAGIQSANPLGRGQNQGNQQFHNAAAKERQRKIFQARSEKYQHLSP